MNLTRRVIFWAIVILLATGCDDLKPRSHLRTQTKSASAKDVILQAKLGKSRDLSPDFMCYNVNATQVADWQNEDFITAVNQLSPSSLRIPGGDVGNYWNWRRGGLIENIAGLPKGLPYFLRFNARKYTAGKLEEFKTSLAVTDTKPIFMLNMLTDDLPSQLSMLRTARDLGMEVKYIELGNELYFNIPNYKKTFPNPRSYGLEAKAWTKAIRQEFPDAEIAVVGVVPPPDKPPRLQHWNKVMRGTVLPDVDAITLHLYNDHGLADAEPTGDYPYFDEADVATILGEPFRNWQNLLNEGNYRAIPKDKQIWITEYNLFEDIFSSGSEPIPRVAGSWTHGLYNLAMSLLFLEESRIESVCNHSLTESSIFGAILNTEDSFVNPADPEMKATPMSLSATGTALSLLGTATKSMTSAASLDFSSATQLQGKGNFTYPALYGWQFSSSSSQQGIVINLDKRSQTVDLSGLFDTASYQQIWGFPRDLVNNPEVLQETTGETNGEIALPPYSVTRWANSKRTTD